MSRPDGGQCARKCALGSACPNGDICGRFDFRAIDPDSGQRLGGPEDFVLVCRPPLNTTCNAARPCPSGQTCLGGDAGVCVFTCSRDSNCASGQCVDSLGGAACGQGVCAPLCDGIGECPSDWYCDQSTANTLAHGRCAATFPGDGGCVGDAGDASTD